MSSGTQCCISVDYSPRQEIRYRENVSYPDKKGSVVPLFIQLTLKNDKFDLKV